MAKTTRRYRKARNAKKHWSREDDEKLSMLWGTVSAKTIARKLGRSVNAVICRKNRLGLGAHLEAGADMALNQVHRTIHGNRAYGNYDLLNWMAAGLPYKDRKVVNCTFRTINIEEFWIWAEQHKDLLNFALFEKYSLGPEPAWVDIKRKADHDNRVKTQPHNKPWSAAEDLSLKRMLARGGYTWTQIAAEVHRTEGACRRRAMDLGIDATSIVRTKHRRWTDEETRIMLEMREAGYSYRQIGEKLGRGERAVEGKYTRLLNPEYFNTTNRIKGLNKHIKYSGIKGVNPSDVRKQYEDGSWSIPFEEAASYAAD